MAKIGRQPTANRRAYEDAKIGKDPILSVFRQQLDTSRPTPNTPSMKMVWSPATSAMNKIISGRADPAAAMKTAQAAVAKLVKGARR